MRKIYKYKIDNQGDTEVRMPAGSKILSAAHQNGEPYIWAMVNTRYHECVRRIRVRTTGEELDLATWMAPFLGTLQLKNARDEYWVVHLFDMGEKNL